MAPRRSHRANFTKGRTWLVVIFLLLRGIDCFAFLTLRDLHRQQMLILITLSTLWTTVLLSTIWFRKEWARYVMISLLLVMVGVAFILEVGFSDTVAGKTIPVLGVYTTGQLAAALMLIFFPSIRKLTSRAIP